MRLWNLNMKSVEASHYFELCSFNFILLVTIPISLWISPFCMEKMFGVVCWKHTWTSAPLKTVSYKAEPQLTFDDRHQEKPNLPEEWNVLGWTKGELLKSVPFTLQGHQDIGRSFFSQFIMISVLWCSEYETFKSGWFLFWCKYHDNTYWNSSAWDDELK